MFKKVALLGIVSLLLITLVVATSQQFLTGDTGHRVGTNQHSQTIGRDGPILLQDIYALEKLRRFNSERIPERVVHARGAGAHGYFISTQDSSQFTAANFLSRPGIRTEIFVRFSTVIFGKHSPETVRDPRGFAIKFKTERDGTFDLVGNNLPVFFIRDHIKFPDMVHSLKPDPITNLQDPNRYFDFFSAIGGTSTNMLTHVYSDLGIPAAYRFMDGNGVHAYKMVNASGVITYVKFRYFTRQGVKNLTMEEAERVQGKDFNHATRDLYAAIGKGDFPRWDLHIQTMREDQLDSLDFNALDATKEWPEDLFPFQKIGTFVLDRVPDNFHLFTEQSAFDPGNFLPGMIEPSEDRLLQGRLISYHETQTHRHSSNNFQTLPVNLAKGNVRNYNQDGVMGFRHFWKGSVNYEPSEQAGTFVEDRRYLYSQRGFCAKTVQKGIRNEQNFKQAGERYRSFSEEQRMNLVKNLAGDLGQVTSFKVKHKICAHFYQADMEYGTRVCRAVGCDAAVMKAIASELEG